jgi:predicted nucleic acid-binding protein
LTLVDSSVWIAYLRGQRSIATDKMTALTLADDILLCDIILLEVLQGARDDRHAARLNQILRRYKLVPLFDEHLAVRAADNFRRLRSIGITVRKTMDLIIGTFCIEHGHRLLHHDRDFEPMTTHLGLLIA